MAMKEFVSMTLNSKQVREACELFVGPRIGESEQAVAEVDPSTVVHIRIVRRRVRNSKGKPA